METPQRIIYEAWKNTPKPIMHETSDTKGSKIIKEVNFALPNKRV